MDLRLGFRELLAAGFAELNKQGIFAAQNWWCNMTGGRHMLKTLVKLPDDASYVFYHAQDDDDLRDQEEENVNCRREDRKPYQIRLVWDGDGERICEILRGVGLGVDWDGSEDTRIRLFGKLVAARSQSCG
jgi:hypothetical protein